MMLVVGAGLALFVSVAVFFHEKKVWTLAVPVVIAFLPLVLPRWQREVSRVAAVLMTGFVVLGAWTVGLAYAPSAFFLAYAAWGPPTSHRDPTRE